MKGDVYVGVEYIIVARYVPPNRIQKVFNLVYDEITEQISLTKEEGTKFKNKNDVNKLLADMVMNRGRYSSLVEGASHLKVNVMELRGKNFRKYDDELKIQFR